MLKYSPVSELIIAVEVGDEVRVRDVLARGGDPKVTIPTDSGTSECLVQFAADRDHAHLLPCLLGAGLSVEGSGTHDQTPLMVAATKGHKTTLEKLLSLGADPLAVDNGGWTALHWATVNDKAECVSTLIPVTPPIPELLQAADGHTPVHLASFGGHEAVLKALEGAGWPLYAMDGDGLTPLHWAVKAGRLDVVRYLLDKDAAPSTGADDDLTPLDLAKRQGKDLAARWLARRSGAVHGDAAHSLNPEVTSSAGVNAAAGDDTLRPEDVRKLLGFREWLIDYFNKKVRNVNIATIDSKINNMITDFVEGLGDVSQDEMALSPVSFLLGDSLGHESEGVRGSPAWAEPKL
ncbi:ankyrin-1-like, partial [Eriocheir sinensis]|uniref:ankyrin-1-like n=1 Tax=Eriocheir sinensis TaxID=95602 RepID=UPI0021C76138